MDVSLSVEPSTFVPGRSARPTLTLTAISRATQPITIFTWPTIFNLGLSQERTNFTVHDLTSDTAISTETTKGPRRMEFSRNTGSGDDEFFVTLQPEVPRVFSHSFALAMHEADCRPSLQEGHRFRFAVSEGEVVQHWWYGIRKDVMASSWRPRVGLLAPSGEPIQLISVEPLEFDIKQSKEE